MKDQVMAPAPGTGPRTGPVASPQTGSAPEAAGGRANQKIRTRRAIVDACRELVRSGADVTMPEVARCALVSEATAYRYFPDLVSLLRETIDGLWPTPAEALQPVAASRDPVERVSFACEFLLRGVLSYQGAARAMISGTVTRPGLAGSRPGIRFGLIDYALAPFEHAPGLDLAQLKRDLAVAVSAEALFILTDLCGLSPDEAIASAVRTASALTAAAFRDADVPSLLRGLMSCTAQRARGEITRIGSGGMSASPVTAFTAAAGVDRYLRFRAPA